MLEHFLGVGGLQAERARDAEDQAAVALHQVVPASRIASSARRNELSVAGSRNILETISHRGDELRRGETPFGSAGDRPQRMDAPLSEHPKAAELGVRRASGPPSLGNLHASVRGRPWPN